MSTLRQMQRRLFIAITAMDIRIKMMDTSAMKTLSLFAIVFAAACSGNSNGSRLQQAPAPAASPVAATVATPAPATAVQPLQTAPAAAPAPKDPPPANLAAGIFTKAEPKANCVDGYNNVGENHFYSATCTTPSEAVWYTWVGAGSNANFQCIAHCPQAQAPAPASKANDPKAPAPKK